jgi:YecR-like lipoprotein
MRVVGLLCIALVAGCAGPLPGVKPVHAGGSRADGIVTMVSTGTIYNPVKPDWRPAQAEASRRCRNWGYDGAGSFSGWQEACRVYDIHGRCAATSVTRFYPCTGEG